MKIGVDIYIAAFAQGIFSENSLKNIYLIPLLLVVDVESFDKNIIEVCRKSEHLFVFYGTGKIFKDVCIENDIEFENIFKPAFISKFPQNLVNAIQKKDKKNAWIEFYKELKNTENGKEKNPEEMFGLFIYAYKNLLTVFAVDKYDEKSGIKEFQYKSVKQNLIERFKKNANINKVEMQKELNKDYLNLILIQQNSRSKNLSLSSELERWILGW